MEPSDIELRIQEGGFRWLLQPYADVEVWRGLHLLGTMSGTGLTQIVAHHLATAALQAAIGREMAGHIGEARPVPLQATRRPLAKLPLVTREQKDRLRMRRLTRRRLA